MTETTLVSETTKVTINDVASAARAYVLAVEACEQREVEEAARAKRLAAELGAVAETAGLTRIDLTALLSLENRSDGWTWCGPYELSCATALRAGHSPEGGALPDSEVYRLARTAIEEQVAAVEERHMRAGAIEDRECCMCERHAIGRDADGDPACPEHNPIEW